MEEKHHWNANRRGVFIFTLWRYIFRTDSWRSLYLSYLSFVNNSNNIGGFYFLQSKFQNLKSTFKTAWCFFPSRFSCYVKVIFSGYKENRRGLYLSLWITQTKLQTFSERWCLTPVVLPRPPKSVCSREKEKLQSLFFYQGFLV